MGLFLPRDQQKPPMGARINHAHPLAPDLLCVIFNEWGYRTSAANMQRAILNLVTSKAGKVAGSYNPWSAAGPDGMHLQCVRSGGVGFGTDYAAVPLKSGNVSVYVRGYFPDAAANRGICLLGGPAGTPRYHALVSSNLSSGIQWVLSAVVAYNSNIRPTGDQWASIGIAYRKGVNTFFRTAPLFGGSGGVKTALVTTTGTPRTEAQGNAVASTAAAGDSTAWATAFSVCYGWNRLVSEAEFAALDAAPFCFLTR